VISHILKLEIQEYSAIVSHSAIAYLHNGRGKIPAAETVIAYAAAGLITAWRRGRSDLVI
jgi:hypothetical protein